MNSLLAVINCNKYWMQIKHKRDDQIYMYILCKVSISFIYSMSLTWKDYLIVCFQKEKNVWERQFIRTGTKWSTWRG